MQLNLADQRAHYAAVQARINRHEPRQPVVILPPSAALPPVKVTAKAPNHDAHVLTRNAALDALRLKREAAGAAERLSSLTGVSFERVPKVDEIVRATAKRFNISTDDLRGPRRAAHLTVPRHIAMFIARKVANRSLNDIAQRIGGRDHTTVLHGVRKLDAMVEAGHVIALDIEAIIKALAEAQTAIN